MSNNSAAAYRTGIAVLRVLQGTVVKILSMIIAYWDVFILVATYTSGVWPCFGNRCSVLKLHRNTCVLVVELNTCPTYANYEKRERMKV